MRMRMTRMRKSDSHAANNNNNNDDNDANKNTKMSTKRTWDEDTTIKKRTRTMRDDHDEG